MEWEGERGRKRRECEKWQRKRGWSGKRGRRGSVEWVRVGKGKGVGRGKRKKSKGKGRKGKHGEGRGNGEVESNEAKVLQLIGSYATLTSPHYRLPSHPFYAPPIPFPLATCDL